MSLLREGNRLHTSVLGDTVYIHTYVHQRWEDVLSGRFVVYPGEERRLGTFVLVGFLLWWDLFGG